MNMEEEMFSTRLILFLTLLFSASTLLSLSGCAKSNNITITKHAHIAQIPPQPLDSEALDDLSPKLLELAHKAYQEAKDEGLTSSPLLTIIDYSMPSSQKRLWTLNMENNELYYYEYVSHGSGSGKLMATEFSNIPESHQTSLGLYRTENVYPGKYGPALHLQGLEPGINDKAFDRHIVLHGSRYVGEEFAKKHGYTGRSWGCPVVNTAVVGNLIDLIKNGSLILMYYPQESWVANSRFLQA